MIDTQINKIQNENIDHSPEAEKSQSTPQIYYCLTWKEQKSSVNIYGTTTYSDKASKKKKKMITPHSFEHK